MQQTNDVLFNLLDSHDTKRLRSDVKNLDEYFAQIAVLFAMPGSPCIYYGTEIAMEGSYDPDCRRCMPWSDIEAGKYAERSRIISTLIHLRRQEPLLKSRNFHFPNDYAAYRRVIQFQKVDFPDCYVEVLINCCEEDVEVVPQGEILLERHYIDSTLLSNGILTVSYTHLDVYKRQIYNGVGSGSFDYEENSKQTGKCSQLSVRSYY